MSELVTLTQEKRRELNALINQMIVSAKVVRDQLEARWAQIDRIYAGERVESLVPPWDSAPTYDFPILQSKIDSVTSFTAGSVTKLNPYVIMRAGGPAAEQIPLAESVHHYFLAKGAYTTKVRQGINLIQRRGKAMYRVSYDPTTEGWRGNTVKPKICLDVLDMRNFLAYPSTANSVEEWIMHGHAYDQALSTVESKCLSGEYYREASKLVQTGTNEPSRMTNTKIDLRSEQPQRLKDENVECYSLILRTIFEGDPVDKLYIAEYDYNGQQLMSLKEFPYDTSWYVEAFFHKEPDTFFNQRSRGYDLVGPQFFISDMRHLSIWTSMVTAFPAVFVQNWTPPDDFTRPSPGTVIPVDRGAQPFTVNGQANAGIFPQMERVAMQDADTVAKVSQMGQGSNLRSDTTATEAGLIAQGQTIGVNEDVENLSIGLANICKYVTMLLRVHYDDWAPAYEDVLGMVPPEIFDVEYWYEVNGQTPLNAPQALMSQVSQIMQFIGPSAAPILQQYFATQPQTVLNLLRSYIESTTLPGKESIMPRPETENTGGMVGQNPLETQPEAGLSEPDAGGGGMGDILSLLMQGGGGVEGQPPIDSEAGY